MELDGPPGLHANLSISWRALPAGAPREGPGRPPATALRVGLVNNMPDAAFPSTERQLSGLLAAAAQLHGVAVEVVPYALAGVPRSPALAERVEACYFPAASAPDDGLAALIITGAEPRTARLADETYWPSLADLVAGVTGRVPSVLLSCLAAHAAMQIVDGLQRSLLPAKLTGVFAQRSDWGHPLAAGLGDEILVPHSRLNGIPVAAVVDAGWRLAVSDPPCPTAGHGWTVVTKAHGATTLVAVQGHPEYDSGSLLREYRRDIERFLRSEVTDPPVLPERCASPADQGLLEAFQGALAEGPRDRNRLAGLDVAGALARAPWPWRDQAVRFYANWLASLGAAAQGR